MGPKLRVYDIYNHIIQSEKQFSRANLSWIWKLLVASRVQLFWWKVCWGCLPCNALLEQWDLRIHQGSFYTLCQHAVEDIQHCLVACLCIARIWEALQTNHLSVYHFYSLEDLIHLTTDPSIP